MHIFTLSFKTNNKGWINIFNAPHKDITLNRRIPLKYVEELQSTHYLIQLRCICCCQLLHSMHQVRPQVMYVLQINGLNREICVDNKNFETFIKYVYAQETA